MSAAALFKAGKGAQGLAVAAVIGLAVFGVVWLIRNRQLFNPTSDKNLAYQGTNSVARGVAGLFSDNVRADDTTGTLAFDAVDAIKGIFGKSESDVSVSDADLLRICRASYARTGKAVPQCVEILTKYGT